MELCVITFRSVTPAQRGEEVLRRGGFLCNLQRTPRWMESKGCGYSLRVRCDEIVECVQLLRQNKVQFRKVYLRSEDGKLEEMAL